MKRLVLLIVLFFCFSFSVYAQNTNVSGTVTDSGGQAWVLGTYEFDFVPSPRFQGQYRQNGVPFNPVSITGNLDATASFSTVPVPDNNTITPSGTQWAVTVCPQATTKCFTSSPIVITGASQTITSSLVPPAIVMSCGPSQKGYADAEVQCQQGGFYFGLVANQIRLCTSSTPPNTCNTWIGAAGTAAAGGIPIQTQVNNANIIAGTPCESFNNLTLGPENVDCDWHSKGPNPWIDITRFGARACTTNVTPCAPGITASTTNGSASVTISSASTFVNGDGVVCYGCGAPHSMTTPTAPTVTPSIAQVLTGTRYVSNGPTGATTYTYQVFAEDKNGGLTAASPTTSTTTGAATLGGQTVNVTSCSRTNDLTTCTTSAPHGLATTTAPQMVQMIGASDVSFVGWYTTSNVADTTHFSFVSSQDTRNGAPSSSTGGTVSWWNCNHITWSAVTGAYRYWIAGRTGGSLTTIGYSWPVSPTVTQTQLTGILSWDDFGSPMADHLVLPAWIPSTPPSVATSDHLSTTIVSGAQTTSLILANTAGTTLPSAIFLLDAVPGIKAAETAAQSPNKVYPVYFPNTSGTTSFVVNSFLDLTSFTSPSLMVSGGLQLNNTLQLPFASKISGISPPAQGNNNAFAYESLPQILVNFAYPGIHLINGVGCRIEVVAITGNVTGGQNLLVVQDFGGANPGTTYSRIALAPGTSFDLMGIGLVARGQAGSLSAQLIADQLLSLPGAPLTQQGLTATPGIICDACALMTLNTIQEAHRGIFLGLDQEGGGFKAGQLYMQGSVTPAITLASAIGNTFGLSPGQSIFSGQATMDSTGNPITWFAGASPFAEILVDHAGVQGNGNPVFSGARPAYIASAKSSLGFGGGTNLGSNRDVTGIASSCTIDGIFTVGGQSCIAEAILFSDAMIGVGPSYGIFVDGAPMAAPSGVVSAGGGVPVGAHTYQVAPVWQNGGIGEFSRTSAAVTTTTGNQTVTLSWTPTLGGCKGYYILRDAGNISGPPYPNVTPCSASSFVDTFSSAGGGGPTQPSGGPSMLMPGVQGIAAPTLTVAGFPTTGPFNSGVLEVSGYQNSAYDNFNRANGGLGSNWTVYTSNCPNGCGTSPQISSNQLASDGTGQNHAASYSAVTFSADQFAQITWASATTATTNFQLLVRSASGTAFSFFSYDCLVTGTGPTTFSIQENQTNLVSTTGTLNVGDVLRCEAQGNTITFKQNGVVLLTTTNSQVLSGIPAIMFNQGANSSVVDNFSAGNLHPIAQLDAEQDWTQPQHFLLPVTIGPTNPVPGTLNANTLYTNGNAFGSVYATISSTTGASIGTTTMTTAPASGAKYVFTLTAYQVAGGTSCTTNTTMQGFVNFTDAVTSAAQTPSLGAYSNAANSFTGNQIPVLAVNNGVANVLAIQYMPITINAKASTTVSYGTTYTAGTGCAPAPTYYVTPSLVQIQ